MSIVSTFKSMSLDGFIAGPDNEIDPLHDWLFTTRPQGPGWVESGGNPEKFFGPEGVNKEILDEAIAEPSGATIIGRNTYDVTNGWGGMPPFGGSYFVMTHNPPPRDEISSKFTFVTDGVESALRQAQAVAGGNRIGLMGASVVQQFLSAGLLDEIVLQLIPVLLGKGIRLFDHLGDQHIKLEKTRLVEGPGGVTHLWMKVLK
jgi:dihydrofolate reductase